MIFKFEFSLNAVAEDKPPSKIEFEHGCIKMHLFIGDALIPINIISITKIYVLTLLFAFWETCIVYNNNFRKTLNASSQGFINMLSTKTYQLQKP